MIVSKKCLSPCLQIIYFSYMSSIDLIVFIPSSFLPSTTDYIRSYKLHFHPYNHVNVCPNILVCTFYCAFQSLNISTFFQKKKISDYCLLLYWESISLKKDSASFHFVINQTVVVHLLSHVQLCNPMDYTAHQAFLFFTISQRFLRFMSIESVML